MRFFSLHRKKLTPFQRTVKSRLKLLLQARGDKGHAGHVRTASLLAKESHRPDHYTTAYVDGWFKDDGMPSLHDMADICRAYRVTMDYFVEGTGKPVHFLDGRPVIGHPADTDGSKLVYAYGAKVPSDKHSSFNGNDTFITDYAGRLVIDTNADLNRDGTVRYFKYSASLPQEVDAVLNALRWLESVDRIHSHNKIVTNAKMVARFFEQLNSDVFHTDVKQMLTDHYGQDYRKACAKSWSKLVTVVPKFTQTTFVYRTPDADSVIGMLRDRCRHIDLLREYRDRQQQERQWAERVETIFSGYRKRTVAEQQAERSAKEKRTAQMLGRLTKASKSNAKTEHLLRNVIDELNDKESK